MKPLHFPAPYEHKHPPVRDLGAPDSDRKSLNQKAEEEVRAILDHLASQDNALLTIHEQLLEIRKRLETAAPSRSE